MAIESTRDVAGAMNVRSGECCEGAWVGSSGPFDIGFGKCSRQMLVTGLGSLDGIVTGLGPHLATDLATHITAVTTLVK